MSKRIVEVSNLVDAIENGMISIVSVENKTKASADVTETDQVSPEKFVESIQYLNEATLFRNGIDFYYEFASKNGIHIDCAMKNSYLDEYFCVDGVIKEGIARKDIDKKFRETVFDKAGEKVSV